jgi:type I protein arginine methyltransferase
MPYPRLQRLTAGVSSVIRHGLARTEAWIRARPALDPWLYPPEEEYREFNGWYFGHFGEQEKMVADKPRMDFYHAAIGRRIQPGDRVVDLGTGTGILAAFAARRGAAKVYALDHSAIIQHARTLAEANQIKTIEFVAIHSTDFTVTEPVDVILHEQMGDWLFDEEMIANISDLRDRILKPGGSILPARFELYCEPVKVRDERHVPFLWELEVHGYNYSAMERHRPQEAGYYHVRGGDLGAVDYFLGEPEPLLTVDLHTLQEKTMPREVRFSRTVTRAGRLDGFAVYFRTMVDDDLVLSSSPLDPGRAPHWGFRILRTERGNFAVGDVIEVCLTVERWSKPDSWRWSHVKRSPGGGAEGEPVQAIRASGS